MSHDCYLSCTMNFTVFPTMVYLLKISYTSLLRITTWITSLESWCRDESTRFCLRVVILKIYSKTILKIVTRIATGMFQQGLSLDSFKNSFVGDFGTLALNPSPEPIATRPTVTLWTDIWYNSPLWFYGMDKIIDICNNINATI